METIDIYRFDAENKLYWVGSQTWTSKDGHLKAQVAFVEAQRMTAKKWFDKYDVV
jgi:hypothetical protein